jgi:hypothetical protein
MSIEKLKGKLEFTSIFNIIKLTAENGEVIDLRDYIFNVLSNLNGKKISLDSHKMFYLREDSLSKSVLEYENKGKSISIWSNHGTGIENIEFWLSSTMQEFNNRDIIIEITDNGISITPNPDEKVFGLYYTGEGNCCKIEEGKEKAVCKVGTTDCCIFLVMGSKGFECAKFDTFTSRNLLGRHSKNEMKASRIGNCALLGRK